MSELNISANRQARKWTKLDLLRRVLWAAVHPLFACSPRPFWAWRNFMLRAFGAEISSGVRIHPTVRVTIPWNVKIGADSAIGDRAQIYALGQIIIGDRSTISQNAHICAGSHDLESSTMELLKLPITIGLETWICADAFIGPNVHIGDRSVIGARAVVTKNVPKSVVMAGNPARQIGTRP